MCACGPAHGSWRLALVVLFTSLLLYVALLPFGKIDPFLLAFHFLLLTGESAATQITLCVLVVACRRELGIVIMS